MKPYQKNIEKEQYVTKSYTYSKPLILVTTTPYSIETLTSTLNKIFITSHSTDVEILIVKNNFISFAYGFNQGVKYVLKNPHIKGMFNFGDDCYPISNDWFKGMQKMSEEYNNNAVIVCPTLKKEDHVCFGGSYFPREVLEKVGLLDERFKIVEWEDVDWSIRATILGVQLVGYKEEMMKHNHGEEKFKYSDEQIGEKKKNKERFNEKWKGSEWERK